MKASIHFTNSMNAGGCNLCGRTGEHDIMALHIEQYEIRTCEKCLPGMLGALQGIVVRLETILKAVPKK